MLLKRGTVAEPYKRSEVWTFRLTMKSEAWKVETRIECGCSEWSWVRCVDQECASSQNHSELIMTVLNHWMTWGQWPPPLLAASAFLIWKMMWVNGVKMITSGILIPITHFPRGRVEGLRQKSISSSVDLHMLARSFSVFFFFFFSFAQYPLSWK